MCPGCLKGYCESCESAQKVQNAVICPACDGLCVGSAQYEQMQARGRQQARSLMQEVGTIVAYPLRDVMGFVMLALFTWFFGMLAKFAMVGGAVAIALSQGVLLSYCFFALSRVASGNLRDFMPDFRDISDLTQPLRLGLAALIISSGPLVALTVIAPGLALFSAEGPAAPTLPVAHAQVQPPPSPGAAEEEAETPSPRPDETSERPRASAPAGLIVLFGLALLWKLAYTPVALTVAALSRGFFKTLNPLLGLDTMRRMGTIYWQALAIYSVLAAGQWLLGLALGLIPIAGGIVRAFVDAYAYLAIGCTLGLAVFKKARELGWD